MFYNGFGICKFLFNIFWKVGRLSNSNPPKSILCPLLPASAAALKPDFSQTGIGPNVLHFQMQKLPLKSSKNRSGAPPPQWGTLESKFLEPPSFLLLLPHPLLLLLLTRTKTHTRTHTHAAS